MDKKSKESVLKYLQKSEESLAEHVELVRKWFENQPHLPDCPSTSTIEFFVMNNHFNLEGAKQKLDAYLTMRTALTAVFGCSNPSRPEMHITMDSTQIIALPKNVDDLYGIIVIKVRENVPEILDPHWWLAAIINSHELKIQESSIMNYYVVYDHEHLTMNHILKITPLFIINCTKMAEKGLGERIKSVHFINIPPMFQLILKLCKSLMRPQMYDRLHLHSTMESFTKYFSLDILPTDYGGKEKCLDELEEIWVKKYEEYKDHFDRLDTLRVNESLRRTDADNGVMGFNMFNAFNMMFNG